MTTDVEFVVVGCGVAGAATARALARAGQEVIALEQFHIGHKRGSSHGASRIFRFSYPDPRYVRMAMDSLALWRELESEMGMELVTTTGGLDAGKALSGHVAALERCRARFELIDGRTARERFPALSLPDSAEVLFQPDAGIIHADRAVRALADSAVSHGAEIRERTEVGRLTPDAGGVAVAIDGKTFRARVAVVTAGAWARALLAPAGIELPVTATRETVSYFHMDDEATVPSLVDWGEPSFYALASPGQGLKAGLHHSGPQTDPRLEGPVSDDIVARVCERVAERYPAADPQPVAAETCLYTNTADEHFVLERRGPIVVGSACSGHGFKFAPLTGQRLASLGMNGAR